MPIDVTRRRFRSSDESDQLPYAKAAAHRAARTTIGQDLKTLSIEVEPVPPKARIY